MVSENVHMSQNDTLKALENSTTVKGAWDEIEGKTIKLLHFLPGTKYIIRLVGPLVASERIYLDYNNYLKTIISVEELKSIIFKDEETMSKVHKRCLDRKKSMKQALDVQQPFETDHRVFIPDRVNIDNSTYIDSALKNLNAIFNGQWQKCIFANVVVRFPSMLEEQDADSYIVAISHNMMRDLISNTMRIMSVEEMSGCVISGLNAHDIYVVRQGRKIQTRYVMGFEPKASFLTELEITSLFQNGLVDIPQYLRVLNKKNLSNRSSYIFRKNDKCILPDNCMQTIFDELDQFEIESQLNYTEKQFVNLPDSAFENIEKMNHSISSLELDNV